MAHEDADPKTHPNRDAWRELYAMDPDTAIDAIIWGNRRWRRLEGVIDRAVAALDRDQPAEARAILAQMRYDQLKRLPADGDDTRDQEQP